MYSVIGFSVSSSYFYVVTLFVADFVQLLPTLGHIQRLYQHRYFKLSAELESYLVYLAITLVTYCIYHKSHLMIVYFISLGTFHPISLC